MFGEGKVNFVHVVGPECYSPEQEPITKSTGKINLRKIEDLWPGCDLEVPFSFPPPSDSQIAAACDRLLKNPARATHPRLVARDIEGLQPSEMNALVLGRLLASGGSQASIRDAAATKAADLVRRGAGYRIAADLMQLAVSPEEHRRVRKAAIETCKVILANNEIRLQDYDHSVSVPVDEAQKKTARDVLLACAKDQDTEIANLASDVLATIGKQKEK